jgi:pimeloyl-ACP methyl ester carboxylesterase
MSLNATIFPELGIPTVSPDLSGIELGTDGITAELRRDGFDCYVRLIETDLERSCCWNSARRVVVAHSFGGMLAMHWLTEHQDSEFAQIDGLVIVSSTPGPMYETVRLRIPMPWNSDWRIGVNWLIPSWNHQTTTRVVKRLMCGGKLDATPVNFGELDIRSETDLGRAGWRNVDWRALRAFRFTMQGFDVRARLHEITVPTIVLHGTDDSLFASEDARLLAELIPSAELRLLDGADHALPVTHSEAIVRAVTDLIRT